MDMNIVKAAREHFGNPPQFWVDQKDENGEFPNAPTKEAIENAKAFSFTRGHIVEREIQRFYNDAPVSHAPYVAYIGWDYDFAGKTAPKKEIEDK